VKMRRGQERFGSTMCARALEGAHDTASRAVGQRALVVTMEEPAGVAHNGQGRWSESRARAG